MKIHMGKVGETISCSVNNSEIFQCNEWEKRSEKAEARCAELELELQKKKEYCEALEVKLNSHEKEKIAKDGKLEFLGTSSEAIKRNQLSGEREKKKKDVDLEQGNEEGDKAFQLTVEMRILEIEKIKAESEAQVWKERFKKLESRALELGLKLANLDEENGKQDSVLVKPKEHSHDFLQNQGIVVNLGDVASCNSPSAGTPSNEICWGTLLHGKPQLYRRARKRLALESQQSPSNKMAPCTPRGGKPTSTCVIDIIDSDDEPKITQQPMLDNQDIRNISFSTHAVTEEEKLSDNSLKRNFCGGNDEDFNSGMDVQFTAMPKRKRTQNVVTSESESDDDDMPISKLRSMHNLKVSPKRVRCDLNELVSATSPVDDRAPSTVTPRRRLVPLRKCVIKSQQDKKSSRGPSEDKHERSIPTNEETNELEEVSSDNEKGSFSKSEDASDGEVESDSQDGQEDKKSSCGPIEDKHRQSIPTNKETGDDESGDEGSLNGFIVHDSYVSEATSSKSHDASEDTSSKSHDASDNEANSDSPDVSDEDLNLKGVLSQFQRYKDQKRKWEFEADMLAAFGKDPQLCMKAVCTLYRQQTSEEQKIKGSLHYNGRGFSNVDAFRGSTLAVFLTDGDPLDDVKKSVGELKEYDPRGVETCRTMAFRYSKQLFEIYKNKEDPFFP